MQMPCSRTQGDRVGFVVQYGGETRGGFHRKMKEAHKTLRTAMGLGSQNEQMNKQRTNKQQTTNNKHQTAIFNNKPKF